MAVMIFPLIGVILGIIAFLGDFIITFIIGAKYPNYSHLDDTMSELGNIKSKYRMLFTIWWVIFGFFIIVFAVGLGNSLAFENAWIILLIVFIAVFGFGAGIIAGIFPLDPKGEEETISGKLHGIFAGIGFLTLLFVPITSVLLRYTRDNVWLLITAIIIQVIGLISFILFILTENTKIPYPGLWQRIFLASNYSYLIILAISIILLL